MHTLSNKIMLTTYADSLGGGLNSLYHLLDRYYQKAVGGIHILPFFPSSADRGFSPITYKHVDPAFGNWGDIVLLSRKYYLMCDLMINHVSRSSEEFMDFIKNGDKSPYSSMFLDYRDFWDTEPKPQEFEVLYRRKAGEPFVTVPFNDGTVRDLWSTFSAEQIDIDINQQITRQYLFDNLKWLAEQGFSLIRLDAYGYVTKIRGTSCFFVEPQIWEPIQACQEVLTPYGATLLPEVHDTYQIMRKISDRGYWTYDFVLPFLMLFTLHCKDGGPLKKWLEMAPQNQFTVLDTHDGVGIYDSHGIVSEEMAKLTVEHIKPWLSLSYKPLNPEKFINMRAYQLYGTFYSLLGEEDAAYLAARAIQFFAPGIPQVYYVGLLAGKNDLSFDESDHRTINRKNYTPDEFVQEQNRPIVAALRNLMEFRNTHAAFEYPVILPECAEHQIIIQRGKGECFARLEVDLLTRQFNISYTSSDDIHLINCNHLHLKSINLYE